MTANKKPSIAELASKINSQAKRERFGRYNPEAVDEARLAELEATDYQKTVLINYGVTFQDGPVHEGGLNRLAASEMIATLPLSTEQLRFLMQLGADESQVDQLTRSEATQLIDQLKKLRDAGKPDLRKPRA